MKSDSNGSHPKAIEDRLDALDHTLQDYVKQATKEMFKLLERHEELEEKLAQEQMKITNLLITHQQKNRPNKLNHALVALFIVMLAVTTTFIGSGFLVYKQFRNFYTEQMVSFKDAIAQKDATLTEMSKEFEDYIVKSRDVILQLQNEIQDLKGTK